MLARVGASLLVPVEKIRRLDILLFYPPFCCLLFLFVSLRFFSFIAPLLHSDFLWFSFFLISFNIVRLILPPCSSILPSCDYILTLFFSSLSGCLDKFLLHENVFLHAPNFFFHYYHPFCHFHGLAVFVSRT